CAYVAAEDSKNAPARGARGGTASLLRASDIAQFTCAGCPVRGRVTLAGAFGRRDCDGIQRSSAYASVRPGASPGQIGSYGRGALEAAGPLARVGAPPGRGRCAVGAALADAMRH